jgi:hypothetical protein
MSSCCCTGAEKESPLLLQENVIVLFAETCHEEVGGVKKGELPPFAASEIMDNSRFNVHKVAAWMADYYLGRINGAD